MDFDIKKSMDTIGEGVKNTAEVAHKTTESFHENYVSKVIPDMGKYGDAAKFVAEMAPGVGEYNAIREGDWTNFAITAGVDVTAIAAGAFTAGAGYAAVKGGSVAAKTGVKVAVKEVAEAGTKKAVKEVAETGTKKAVKEVAETGTKKATKEIVEGGVKDSTEKVVIKATKEVGEKLDKELVPKYLNEVETITNRDIKPQQLEKLNKALKEQDFAKLDPEKSKLHRKLFDNVKDKLIDEWEKNTGDTWPVYQEDVVNKAGEVIRTKGQRFDAHHLIESSYGGPNSWWNLHPAAFPSEHQGGIHAANGIANLLF